MIGYRLVIRRVEMAMIFTLLGVSLMGCPPRKPTPIAGETSAHPDSAQRGDPVSLRP